MEAVRHRRTCVRACVCSNLKAGLSLSFSDMQISYKIIVVSLSVLLGLAFLFAPKPPLQLQSAFSQNWTAGMAGGGSGINYTFHVRIQTNEKIRFDSAWLNGKSYPIQAVKGNLYNPRSEFFINDTLLLKVTEFIPGRRAGSKNNSPESETGKPKTNPPVKYKGEALISYFLGDKRHYFSIPKITKLPPANMP